jgi:hypothetical protein
VSQHLLKENHETPQPTLRSRFKVGAFGTQVYSVNAMPAISDEKLITQYKTGCKNIARIFSYTTDLDYVALIMKLIVVRQTIVGR